MVLAIFISIDVLLLENSKSARKKLHWLLCLTINRNRIRRNRVSVDRVVAAQRKFLLTLSDQQLVTGIGICVAAYVSICSTQLHDFLNGCHLALLSFAVHALTVLTLRPQFRQSRGRAYLRLALAGVNVVLLSPILFHIALTTASGAFDSSLEAYPACCLFNGAFLPLTTTKGWVIFGLVVLLVALAIATVLVYVFVDREGLRGRGLVVRILPYLAGSLIGVCVIFAVCVTTERLAGLTLKNLVVQGSANVWGFGQILPIAMLLLMPLALLEMELPRGD
jgi:hypothetical protein